MKRLVLSFTMLALVATASQAQDAKTKKMSTGKTGLIVEAGIGMNKFYGKTATDQNLTGSTFAVKLRAGLTADVPLASEFSFQPGVMLATKGTRYKSTTTTGEERFNLYYIDVPMNFVYRPVSGTGHVLVGFGPYVGFGIGGKYTRDAAGSSPKVITDIEYRGTVSTADAAVTPKRQFFKRFDGGANVFVGYESSNRFMFKVGTQVGLTNMEPDRQTASATSNKKTKNLGVGLTLGYRLGH